MDVGVLPVLDICAHVCWCPQRSDHLELELQMGVSHHVGAGK